MKTGDAILALALGAGGGLLIWYLTRGTARRAPAEPTTSTLAGTPPATAALPHAKTKPATLAAPSTALAKSPTGAVATAPPAPVTASPTAPGPCKLFLGGSGLAIGGEPVDIQTAVARCKIAGRADLVFTTSGPAQVYLDLNQALHDASVPVTVQVR